MVAGRDDARGGRTGDLSFLATAKVRPLHQRSNLCLRLVKAGYATLELCIFCGRGFYIIDANIEILPKINTLVLVFAKFDPIKANTVQ